MRKGMKMSDTLTRKGQSIVPPVAFARRTDPDTSHAAAAAVGKDLTKLQITVIAELSQCGARGSTSNEMADKLRIDRCTLSPRFRPLATLGLIADSGERRAIPGHGRPGIVWKLARYVGQQ